MNRMIKLSGVWLVVTAMLLAIVAWAGMKKSPEDKQKQAFDDFRGKVADVIEVPEREAQAIALISDLQQNFFDVRDHLLGLLGDPADDNFAIHSRDLARNMNIITSANGLCERAFLTASLCISGVITDEALLGHKVLQIKRDFPVRLP